MKVIKKQTITKKKVAKKAKKSAKVNVGSKKDKLVKINMVDNPLDTYRSPHLLDLSRAKYIEKISPVVTSAGTSYADLPGGKLLEKLYIFELLSFEDSEIVLAFRKLTGALIKSFKYPFQRVDFSPKLPLTKNNKTVGDRLVVAQEISFINLISSIISGLVRFGRFFYTHGLGQAVNFVSFYGRKVLTGPEQINFSLRKSNLSSDRPQNIKATSVKKPKILKEVDCKFAYWPQVFRLKTATILIILALLVVVPIKFFDYVGEIRDTKGQVLGEAEQALTNLNLAQTELKEFNFIEAQNYFASAGDHFVTARNQLNNVRSFLTVLAESSPVSNTFRSGKNLLDLGDHLSTAGEHLLLGMNELTGESDMSLTSRIKNFKVESSLALEEFKLAQINLDKINISHLPEENQEVFSTLQAQLPYFISSLEKSDEVIEFAIDFLGDNELKRYLLVFQNDNELRATGGFMGSFALIDLKSGNIEDIQIPGGGTYEVRAGLNELLQSPQPMQLLNPRWEFQDANWWPNWPTSADSIAWFYEKSGGPTVDGVIAINSDWLANLLGVLGPIELPDYNKTITAVNFEAEIQKEVEIEYENEKQPKKILGDLAPEIMDRLFNVEPKEILNIASVLGEGLNSKDILISLSDKIQDNLVAQNNWNGEIKDADMDYLYVIDTNIGGGKTSNAVDQEIYHQAKITTDGSIVNNLLIRRSHFGPIDDNFTNIANRSYLRIYVPEGSELVQAVGFNPPYDFEWREVDNYLTEDERLMIENQAQIHETSQTKIYNEDGKTVFANWLTINPGESKDLLLVYKLPFKLSSYELESKTLFQKFKAAFTTPQSYDSYSLMVQKQSGSNDDKIISSINYANNFIPRLIYPVADDSLDGQIIFKKILDRDILNFVSFIKK